jgi:hypothetical protein
MFLNLLFIFLNFAFIVFSTINVENNMTTCRNNDSCKLELIIFAVLSRNKIWISFFIWAFRLNKDKFVRTFCVFATSSRRLSSDDITSIFTSCYALIRIRKRDYTTVYKAFRVWLLTCFDKLLSNEKLSISSNVPIILRDWSSVFLFFFIIFIILLHTFSFLDEEFYILKCFRCWIIYLRSLIRRSRYQMSILISKEEGISKKITSVMTTIKTSKARLEA